MSVVHHVPSVAIWTFSRNHKRLLITADKHTCFALCAFLEADPFGYVLLQQRQAGLMTYLTSLHDDLVPQINDPSQKCE